MKHLLSKELQAGKGNILSKEEVIAISFRVTLWGIAQKWQPFLVEGLRTAPLQLMLNCFDFNTFEFHNKLFKPRSISSCTCMYSVSSFILISVYHQLVSIPIKQSWKKRENHKCLKLLFRIDASNVEKWYFSIFASYLYTYLACSKGFQRNNAGQCVGRY